MTLLIIIIGLNIGAWCWLAARAAAHTERADSSTDSLPSHRAPVS